MGGDCCAPDSLPAAQHMLNDLHLNNAENEGANTAKAASPKTHEQCAQELKDFIKKRIGLFDEYKAREDAKVRNILPICTTTLDEAALHKLKGHCYFVESHQVTAMVEICSDCLCPD